MNRRYDSREYLEKVNLLRAFYEEPAITTDVIVGFPGETEEEFRMTEDFVRQVNFFEMHIFKYSRRKGTRADKMEGQITEAEKGRRSEILMKAEKEMSHAYRAGYIGREVEALFEEQKEKDGQIYWVGHTPQYVKAAKIADNSGCLHNQIAAGRAVGFLEDDILLLEDA